MKLQNYLLRTSLLILIFSSFVDDSYSNERKFTYVYQSGVLGKGSKELEIWSTPRIGKINGYFARIDHRVEFEAGLSERLQTAFYLNFRNITSDNGTGVIETDFEFQGISSEWKYQISNPAIDIIGFALYGELGLNTDEVELETKLIFDKKIKKTTFALNLTVEPEWELTAGEANYELKFEGNFGISYAFSPFLSAGVEIRNANVHTKYDGWKHSALFGGPVISFSQPSWWAAFTIMPQVAAFKGKSAGSKLNLDEFEKFESRLIFSFHI